MSTTRSADAAKVRFPPPLVFALSIGAGWGLGRVAGARAFEAFGIGETARLALAAPLAVVGIIALGWAVVMMLRTGQNPEPWKPTPELLPSGIYRFSRNPMYLGMALVQAALALYFDNVWMLALTPLSLFAVFHIAVKPEERYLEAKFGEGYLAYKARVRRWI